MRQYTMDLTILSLLAMGICCVTGQMFDQLPSNATAMEGSSANFSCTVLSEDSSTQVNSIWGIQVSGKIVHLGENDNVTMDDLNGSGTACIETPFNSPLTIANITRSLDGTRVRCFFIQKFHRNVTLVSQDMPYAFLTVQWLDVSEPNPPSKQLLQVCQNITITVNISGNPVPWIASFVRYDGQDISDMDRVSIVNSTIIFRDLTEDDVGRYNITVSNAAFVRVVFFELTLPPPPTGPLPTPTEAGCDTGCIIGIVVAIIVFIVLMIAAVVVVVLLVRMCRKCIRQQKSEGEKEVPLT